MYNKAILNNSLATNNGSLQEKTEEVKNIMTSACLTLFTDVCQTVFDLNEV